VLLSTSNTRVLNYCYSFDAVVGLRGAAAKLMIKGEPLKVTLWFSGFLVLVSKEKDHHFYYCVLV